MNALKVNQQQAILALGARGWSRRRIARELGVDRETVGKYLDAAKPAISTAGSEASADSKPAISTLGSSEAADPKTAISTAGSPAGRRSLCEPLRGGSAKGVRFYRLPRDSSHTRTVPYSTTNASITVPGFSS